LFAILRLLTDTGRAWCVVHTRSTDSNLDAIECGRY
jgi:hypothetical protein